MTTELDQYDFALPKELIAQHPLPHRADARLLIVDRRSGQLNHAHVRDLPELLSPGDCLVLNDTRVLAARLVGRREGTGGRWFGLFLAGDSSGHWHVLSKTRGKLRAGEAVLVEGRGTNEELRLKLVQRLEDGGWLAQPTGHHAGQSPLGLLERFGRVPLPHYIRDAEMEDSDRDDYQTVYAARPGAVAAPTAGLHFTPDLLERLQRAGIQRVMVTLHVGAGTFRPITAQRLEEHQMHGEWCAIEAAAVERLEAVRAAGGRIVAVGSTSVRVLETAACDGTLRPWQGETRLFIRPPYQFRAVDALMTNFHLPRSTLLVMVRTFGGDALLRRAYEQAIEQRYRFFSYGDAMLIL
ncbi:MAG: tRNA preQ1(34) S-adenosylmethionine ribosyltransferase-isomerase QueA [Pirellulaceae bacterium]|nr:tRNA preQ1(34) S-adenosylmethionine ribosyltransferase-isomerase QueA [Pirellulaceae bacterium]